MSTTHSQRVRIMRAARMLLDWTQYDLAEKSGVAVATITSFEAGRRGMRQHDGLKLHAAFEQAGVKLTLGGVTYINNKKE